MADQLVVDLDATPLAWPLGDDALEDLRWYLEDYLTAPFEVYEDRGSRVEAQLADWGRAVFGAVLGAGTVRDDVQLVLRSASPSLLALPWELMVAPGHTRPLALEVAGVSRSLPVADDAEAVPVPGGQLRVLMVISRPAGTGDVGYRMIARPLLERLQAVRGTVDLVVLRPPTLDALRAELEAATAAGNPYQVVHFDGHGTILGGEGALVFERPSGGGHYVPAPAIAKVLGDARVPVVVLNACQSGAVGKELEAAVATALLRAGVASVVAMAYTVYAVAAAEFMAAFYDRLFGGGTVSSAVTAGRQQMSSHRGRPSPKGDLPLEDWLVPVHYQRRDVAFPQARAARPAGAPPPDLLTDRFPAPGAARTGGEGSLDPVGAFVGRDDLFFELEAAAQFQHVTVLSGPAGTGKTELAKAFGRWWRDTGGVDRPEWVLWHSFEPGVASFGLDAVIAQAGLEIFGPQFAQRDQDERRRALEQLLGQRRLLLIWDNFEAVRSMPDPAGATAPLDQAECEKIRAFLAGMAQDAKCRSSVIITSRNPEDWLGGIHRITIGGLATREAIEYANNLLAPYPAARSRRTVRAFGELLAWLDGHPLSMRLMLPRLDRVGPQELLDGLRGIIPLPGDEDSGGDRLTSLPASITYSFVHLAETTRRLLPAVCPFHGVADADVLGVFSQVPDCPDRFAGTSAQGWTEVLTDAARVGLLTGLDSGMWQVHPALPTYLAALWRAEDPEGYEGMRAAATRALTQAYADFGQWLIAKIRSGNAGLAYMLIELQRRTLSSLLGYALDHQMWQQAEAIVQPLGDYWDARGLGQEAAAWTDRTQVATGNPDGTPPRLDSPAGALWLSVTVAEVSRQLEAMRLDEAEATCRHIMAMLQAQPSSPEQRNRIATVSHQLGVAARKRGRLDEAEDWYRKSLAITEDLGKRHGTASGYHELGSVAQSRGRLDEAEDWYRKALAILEDLGDRPSMAGTLHQLGEVAHERERFDEAGAWYRKAVAIRVQLGFRALLATDFHQLGMIAQAQEWLDEAEEWYRKAVAIREELGFRALLATDFHQLGMIAQARGWLDEAEGWHRRALVINQDFGNRPGTAGSYHQLGGIALDQGRLEEAENWYRKAVAIREELGDRHDTASIYHLLGRITQRRQRLEESEEWYRKSLAIFEDLGSRPVIASTYHQLGMVAQIRGRLEEAENWYRRALAIFEDLGNRGDTAAACHQLGTVIQSSGRLEEAEEWYRKSLTLKENLGNRSGMAITYYQLGSAAQDRGRFGEAEDWYHKSLAIFEDLGNQQVMVAIYRQLGAVAQSLGRLEDADNWDRRSRAIEEGLDGGRT